MAHEKEYQITDDEVVKKTDINDILTRVFALIIGTGLFVSDKYLHLIDSIDIQYYGLIAAIALGYTPDISSFLKKK